MTEEKWKDTLAIIKDKFEILEETNEELPEDMGPGQMATIEFIGPLGKMRLEFYTQPLLLDKQTIGSRRIGSDVTVKYNYSETEKIHKFKVYKFNEVLNDWDEMIIERPEMFSF